MHTKGVLSFYMTLYKYQVKHTLIYIKYMLFHTFLFCRKSLPTISYLDYSILRQVRLHRSGLGKNVSNSVRKI